MAANALFSLVLVGGSLVALPYMAGIAKEQAASLVRMQTLVVGSIEKPGQRPLSIEQRAAIEQAAALELKQQRQRQRWAMFGGSAQAGPAR